MSYEFRSGSQTLDLPNPYAVENRLRFAVGSAIVAIGVGLLFLTRQRLAAGWTPFAAVPLFGAVALIAYGVRLVAKGMTQLRFFFGRDRPNSLAKEVPADVEGASPEALELKETIRRGALHLPEPKGAINGLLYSQQRDLIYAPLPLQQLAQGQFRTAIVVGAIFASFCVAWVLLGQSTHGEWLGLLYLGLTSYVVLRPFRARDGAAEASDRLPVALAVMAIVGPVALTLAGPALPSLGAVSLRAATLSMLVLAGAGATLFYLALRAQLGPPPPASSAMHQLAVSMNCQPVQLMDELARRLQTAWREQIPNRRYVVKRPDINLLRESSGVFHCDLVEESQPFPSKQAPPRTLRECSSDPERRWTLYLQMFGATLVLLAATIVALGAWRNTGQQLARNPARAFDTLLFAGAALAVGDHCLRGAHELFGRFDFKSLVYWFECTGNYQIASVDYGNVLSDRLRTSKTLPNIENATLQVWIVEVSSVVFGKDGRRIVRGMIGLKEEAQALAESLAEFARDQSIVVAPSSQQDVRKIAAMAAVGAQGAAPLTGAQAAALASVIRRPDGEGS